MDTSHIDIAHVVQSAVAPVFLISGTAAMLGVLTGRLARLVDRARALERRLEESPQDAAHLDAELRVLARRARYINAAISQCGVSALCVALVVVLLFVNAFFEVRLAPGIASLFTLAMLFLGGAFLAFLIEVRLATVALRIGRPRGGSAQRPAPPP